MFDLLNMARMAKDSYEETSTNLLGRWERQDKPREFGNFYACAYKLTGRSNIVTVAFRGTEDFQDTFVEDLGGIGLALNSLAMELNNAIDYASMWKARAKVLWLTGHSLGGAYVQMVGSIIDTPGVSFNAPGVLSLLNQMSPNKIRAFVTGALHGLTLGKIAYFTGSDDGVMGSIGNYRGEWDPVSRFGVHVGAPLETIKVASMKPHPHSMDPIIRSLQLRYKLKN